MGATNGWSLEVVRGRDVGRRFALGTADLVLGNAPGAGAGLDLSEQEAGSPRRMAGRQALLEARAGVLAIRDLDSPGGTFVNRQRVLPGSTRPLRPGDVIQLGGVQLLVVADGATAAPIPSAPPATATVATAGVAAPASFEYVMKSGTVCRNWDDFLVVAAQKWPELREELTAGRLASFLAAIGRNDLAPAAAPGSSPDERLDAWLGRLPTSRPARPELDLHPSRLAVRGAGGGTTRRSVRIGNVGHRLLHSTIRVEPAGATWLRVAPPYAGSTIVTVEGTDVPIEVDVPESDDARRTAALVVESDGGTGRIEVVVEPRGRGSPIEAVATPPAGGGWGLETWLGPLPPATRLAGFVVVMVALRLMLAACDALVPIPVADPSVGPAPALPRALAGFAILGSVAGLMLALRRGEARDRFPAAFAGGAAGLVVATAGVAFGRTFEAALPASGLPGLLLAVGLWAALGAGAAALSSWLVPHREEGP